MPTRDYRAADPMTPERIAELIEQLAPEERDSYRRKFQRLGALPPSKDSALREGLEGVASGLIQAARGIGSTANELGLPGGRALDAGARNLEATSKDVQAYEGYTALDSFRDPAAFMRTAGQGIGTTIGGMAGTVAGAGVGALAGGPAGAATGAFYGGAAAMFGQEFGPTLEEYRKAMPDQEEGDVVAMAALASIAKAAVEQGFGPQAILSRGLQSFAGAAVKDAVADAAKKSLAKAGLWGWFKTAAVGAAKGSSEGAVSEGGEEVVQLATDHIIKALGGAGAADRPGAREYIENMVAGMVGGGVMGAPAGAFSATGERVQAMESDSRRRLRELIDARARAREGGAVQEQEQVPQDAQQPAPAMATMAPAAVAQAPAMAPPSAPVAAPIPAQAPESDPFAPPPAPPNIDAQTPADAARAVALGADMEPAALDRELNHPLSDTADEINSAVIDGVNETGRVPEVPEIVDVADDTGGTTALPAAMVAAPEATDAPALPESPEAPDTTADEFAPPGPEQRAQEARSAPQSAAAPDTAAGEFEPPAPEVRAVDRQQGASPAPAPAKAKRDETPRVMETPSFRNWRFRGGAAVNTGAIYPRRPGAKFTEDEIAEVVKWAEGGGLQVRFPSKTKISVTDPEGRLLDLTNYSQTGANEEAYAAEKKAREDERKAREDEYRKEFDSKPSSAWVRKQFGDAMPWPSKIALARFLEGEDANYSGLLGLGIGDVLREMGALSAPDEKGYSSIDWSVLKDAYERDKAPRVEEPSAPLPPQAPAADVQPPQAPKMQPAAETTSQPEPAAAPSVEQPAPAPSGDASKAPPQIASARAPVQQFPTARAQIDNKLLPNIKRNANPETGLIEGKRLSGQYRQVGTPAIVLWETLDGRFIVATGRHKFDLAQRNGEPTIPAQVLREADGWTRAQMRTVDAESNILDEQGEVDDYAAYFREIRGTLTEAEGAARSLTERAKGRMGFLLGTFASNDLYSAFLSGRITAERASAIADIARDDEGLQAVGMKKAMARPAPSPQEIQQFIKALKTFGRQAKATQGDLFGFDDSALKESEAMGSVASRKLAELAEDVRVLKQALNRGESLELTEQKAKAYLISNRNDRAQIERALKRAQMLVARWEKWDTDQDLAGEVRKMAGLGARADSRATEAAKPTPTPAPAVAPAKEPKTETPPRPSPLPAPAVPVQPTRAQQPATAPAPFSLEQQTPEDLKASEPAGQPPLYNTYAARLKTVLDPANSFPSWAVAAAERRMREIDKVEDFEKAIDDFDKVLATVAKAKERKRVESSVATQGNLFNAEPENLFDAASMKRREEAAMAEAPSQAPSAQEPQQVVAAPSADSRATPSVGIPYQTGPTSEMYLYSDMNGSMAWAADAGMAREIAGAPPRTKMVRVANKDASPPPGFEHTGRGLANEPARRVRSAASAAVAPTAPATPQITNVAQPAVDWFTANPGSTMRRFSRDAGSIPGAMRSAFDAIKSGALEASTTPNDATDLGDDVRLWPAGQKPAEPARDLNAEMRNALMVTADSPERLRAHPEDIERFIDDAAKYGYTRAQAVEWLRAQKVSDRVRARLDEMEADEAAESTQENAPPKREAWVSPDGLARVEAEVERLNRKASRLGMEPLSVTIGESRQARVIRRREQVGSQFNPKTMEQTRRIPIGEGIPSGWTDTGRTVTEMRVTLNGEVPKLNGWHFVAVVDHLGEDGNIIRELPGETMPTQYREEGPVCEHCNTKRDRKQTFILRHDNGSYKRCGRTCLKDFLGVDNAEAMARRAEMVGQLAVILGESELRDEGERGAGGSPYIDLRSFMPYVAAVLRKESWVPRSAVKSGSADYSTADVATTAMVTAQQDKSKDIVTPEDRAKANAAIEWASTFRERDDVSSLEHNMGVLASAGFGNFHKHLGIAAWIMEAYRRKLGEGHGEPKKPSEYQGEIGKRSEFGPLMVKRAVNIPREPFDKFSADRTMHVFEDGDGNAFIWTTATDPIEVGKSVMVKATVKAHATYKGTKQTVLSRVVVLPQSEPAQSLPQEDAEPDREDDAAQAPSAAPAEAKAASAPAEQGKIDDFGEKIGGARKDTATSGRGGTRRAEKKDDDGNAEPPWRKQYVILERVAGDGFVIGLAKRGMSFAAPSQVFATEEEAEKALPLFAVARSHAVHEQEAGKYAIFKRVGKTKLLRVVQRSFDSREEAMKHMAINAVELLNQRTSFGEEILPTPEIANRVGPARRTTDVTREMFVETFAPRGIEFGNWNNQGERQLVMNHAYDGLLDLAEVLGVTPKALMLNGELAIAFGARGHGLSGARAHYETDYGVINLTKMHGAGSLAHEWFHALDHYLARQDTKAKSERKPNARGDMTYPDQTPTYTMLSHGPSYKSQLRAELKEKHQALIQSMLKRAEKYVEDTSTAERFIGKAKEHLRSNLDNVRRVLAEDTSRYRKRFSAPASAEQLAEFDKLADMLVEGAVLDMKWVESKSSTGKPSMQGHYSNATLEAISRILQEVRGQTGFAKSYGVLNDVSAAMRTYKGRLDMLDKAKGGVESTRTVATNYAIEAKKMDQARTGDYWSEPHEMAARAFAAYVEDKIAERGWQSDFIVYHAHGGILLPMIDGFIARPYPEGDERKAINAMFDAFFGEVKTRTTDSGGVAMYRTAPAAAASDTRAVVTPAQDAEYMAAVERGDVETAQRMVDEAAKRAGYTIGPVWHGTRSKARPTEFDTNRQGQLTGNDIPGTYFTDAKGYARAVGMGGPLGSKYEPDAYYLRLLNMAGKAQENAARYVPDAGMERGAGTHRGIDGKRYLVKARDGAEIRARLEAQGYDGVDRNWSTGHEWIAFSPSQIKSADPITRDDAGRVIPLSERFNDASPDIRFRDGASTDSAALTAPAPSSIVRAASPADQDRARETWRRIVGTDNLSFVDRIFERGAERLGKYSRGWATIATGRGDINDTTLHEAVHAAMDMLLTADERAAVLAAAGGSEERAAEGFIAYANERARGGSVMAALRAGRIGAAARAAMEKLWRFVKRLGGVDGVTGKTGAEALREFYEGLAAGEYAKRGAEAARVERAIGAEAAAAYRAEDAADAAAVTPAQDAEYMAAVERGDMETAQRMVDEAAKRAGYGVGPVWHGTTATKYVDGEGRAGNQSARSQLERMAIKFGASAPMWSDIAGILERWVEMGMAHHMGATVADAVAARNLTAEARGSRASGHDEIAFSVFNLPDESLEFGVHLGTKQQASMRGSPFRFYVDIKNPIRLQDAGRWAYNRVLRDAMKAGVNISESEISETESNQAARDLLIRKGVDGIVYKNEAEGRGDSYIVFKPSQIKSADPVTRDDQGRVIPLSERFNQSSPDIRYRSTAWHGSPHRFDKFTTSRIGTGEGQQAYGWGLYFAGRKEVAEWYRDQLADYDKFDVMLDGVNVQQIGNSGHRDPLVSALVWLKSELNDRVYKSLDEYIANMKKLAAQPKDTRWGSIDLRDDLKKDVALLEAARDRVTVIEKGNGALYEVDLTPEEDEYLLWDKPFSEQSEKVKNALISATQGPSKVLRPGDFLGLTGQEIYQTLQYKAQNGSEPLPGQQEQFDSGELSLPASSDKLTSIYLRSIGIRGVKYLDGGSRDKGEGSYNYVIFDESDVSVTARYRTAPADAARESSLSSPSTPPAPDSDAIRSTLAWLRSFFTELRRKDKNARPDITKAQRLLSTIAHYSADVPALRKIYEAALQLTDAKHRLGEYIFGPGEVNIADLRRFIRANREAWSSKIQPYLWEADRDATGPAVRREGGKFVVYDAAGKALGNADSEDAAWTMAHNAEAQELMADGWTAEEAGAVLIVRGINDRAWDMLSADARAVERLYRRAGLPPPQVVLDEGQSIDLQQALREMGDRRGYYMPRLRKSGRYVLKATKKGANPFRKHFDRPEFRALESLRLRRQGYETTYELNETPSEDAFLEARTAAIEDIINNALKRFGKDLDSGSLDIIGVKAGTESYEREDGTTEKQLVLRGEFNEIHNRVFKDFGGQFYKGAWRFEPAKNLQRDLTQALLHVHYGRVMPLEGFAQSLAETMADVIRSRGSQSRKIGRRQAVGEDVVVGYEEDALKAIGMAGKATAGGMAKRDMVRKMMAAFTGHDESWDQFKARMATEEPGLRGQELWAAYDKQVKERRIDSATQPEAFSEGLDYIRDMSRNEEPSERVVGIMKALAAMKYLSGVAPAMVNMTNLGVMVPAVLNGVGHIPMKRVPMLVGRGLKLYGRFYMHHHFGKGDPLTGDDAWLFREIQRNGWDEQAMNREAIAAMQTWGQRSMAWLTEKMMLPFAVTEKFNRASTIAAGYWGLLEKHEGEITASDRTRYLKQAKEMSDKAHGVYGKANLPALARGASLGAQVFRSGYVFKTFSHNFMAVLLEMGVKRREIPAVLTMMLAPAVMGGVGAIPLKDLGKVVAEMLAEMIPGYEPPDDLEEALYDAVEEVLGAPGERAARAGIAGLAGFDLRGSLSIGVTDIPTTISDLLGAPWSVMTDLAGGAADIAKGDTLKGTEKLLPRVAAAPLKGYRESVYGVTSRNNQPVYYGNEQLRAGLVDAAIRAAGFSPARLSVAREEIWNEKLASRKYDDARGDIYRRVRAFWAKAPYDRDPLAWAAVLNDIQDYNARAAKATTEAVPFITPESIKRIVTVASRPPKREALRGQDTPKREPPAMPSDWRAYTGGSAGGLLGGR